jgi:hypothetical protein
MFLPGFQEGRDIKSSQGKGQGAVRSMSIMSIMSIIVISLLKNRPL